MKRFLLAISLSLPFSVVKAVGVPVFDATNITSMVAQVAQLKLIVEEALAAYESAVGYADMTLLDVFTDPTINQYLPDEVMDAYEQINDLGLAGLLGDALDLYNSDLVHDLCELKSDDIRDNCYGRQISGYKKISEARLIMKNVERRITNLERAKDKLKTNMDEKTQNALEATISIEEAAIQAQQMNLEGLKMAQQGSEEMLEQKRRQIARKYYENDKPIVFTPYEPGSIFAGDQ